MTVNHPEVIMVVIVVNSIGAAVLRILGEGMETAVRGVVEEAVVEDQDVANHEKQRKRNDNMMASKKVSLMSCNGMCLCFRR